MNFRELVKTAAPLVRRHRLVVLITCAIIVISIFSIIAILGGRDIPPTYGPPVKNIPRVASDSELPPKPLEKWGPDPFKDIVREMQIARKRAEEEAERKRKEEEERLAKEEAEKKARLEEERKAREEAERLAKLERERLEREEKQRQKRKMAILYLKVDGILFNPKGDSTAIIEGKPYKTGDIITIEDGEIVIKAIEQEKVLFEDKKSSDTYSVPISR